MAAFQWWHSITWFRIPLICALSYGPFRQSAGGLSAARADSASESRKSGGLSAIPRDRRAESRDHIRPHQHRTGNASSAPPQNVGIPMIAIPRPTGGRRAGVQAAGLSDENAHNRAESRESGGLSTIPHVFHAESHETSGQRERRRNGHDGGRSAGCSGRPTTGYPTQPTNPRKQQKPLITSVSGDPHATTPQDSRSRSPSKARTSRPATPTARSGSRLWSDRDAVRFSFRGRDDDCLQFFERKI